MLWVSNPLNAVILRRMLQQHRDYRIPFQLEDCDIHRRSLRAIQYPGITSQRTIRFLVRASIGRQRIEPICESSKSENDISPLIASLRNLVKLESIPKISVVIAAGDSVSVSSSVMHV